MRRNTLKGVYKLLHRLGFNYTKAIYTLVRADQEKHKSSSV
ncbi:winged helix-turn-helix domain-containing protein [Paenibacillus sp. WQ 127069]|uniref:Winged helix-turn-helix domain-containing protein n=1 Tax=Paenibacillus baimaensis TaxID=2982185 RepID=A0ABT2USL9_9BACL|nr:winged helix-turn-helix domain-containing protein [Paenibacillus sp. WQ 127069]MCU6797659.1 winged helix-turn-helix domain-containing protein [Paenibacillus sp. WQ 127069]